MNFGVGKGRLPEGTILRKEVRRPWRFDDLGDGLHIRVQEDQAHSFLDVSRYQIGGQ